MDDDVLMGDLVGAVADDLLGINEEREKKGPLQMVKFSDEKERSQEEKNILTALSFVGEVILGKCQLKFKENQESNLITEKSIFEVREASRIRELRRIICEIPEKSIEIDLRKKRDIEDECNFLEESKEVNSADQIDQLNALRFKTQMGDKYLSRGRSGGNFGK